MKELHYGEGYVYAHDTEEKLSRMQCLPDSLSDRRYYLPTEEGEEKAVRKRLGEILKWKRDDSDFFDELEVLNDGASWRPVNLIVFGVAILREVFTLVGMLWLLGKYNFWLALLLLLALLPQTLVAYRIQQEAFETMVTRSKLVS